MHALPARLSVPDQRRLTPTLTGSSHDTGISHDMLRRTGLVGRLSIVLVVLSAVFLLVGGEVDAQEPLRFVEHRVTAGETLWGIASSLDTDAGLPATIDTIRDINDLKTSVLQIGQVLRLPE